jgi:hypothetical protein
MMLNVTNKLLVMLLLWPDMEKKTDKNIGTLKTHGPVAGVTKDTSKS